MADYTLYKPQVAWRTFLKNVLLFSAETFSDPAIYSIDVKPLDINELGASTAEKEIGFYVADYIGRAFRITEINVGGDVKRLKVTDDFRFGQSPQSGLQGIVYKSALGGVSPYIIPIASKHLSRTAVDNLRSIDVSIIWKTREKIEFITTNTPIIEDYQDNYAYLYGEFPDVTLIVNNSVGVEWEMQQVPIRNYVGGLLDNIVWDLPDTFSGYIILSR